jgi:uncharacterized membrane protein AbrB (regulator of aidB expression)
MAGLATALGVLLVIVAIPFGLMIGPLALGVVIAFLGWRHVAASLEIPSADASGTVAG